MKQRENREGLRESVLFGACGLTLSKMEKLAEGSLKPVERVCES